LHRRYGRPINQSKINTGNNDLLPSHEYNDLCKMESRSSSPPDFVLLRRGAFLSL
jgi:hypothetical protein